MAFELNYSLSRQDYLDFNRHNLLETESSKRLMRMLRIGFPLMILMLCYVFSDDSAVGWRRYVPWGLAVAAAAAVYFFAIPLLVALNKSGIKRLEKQGKLFYDKPVTLRFEEDSFSEQTADSAARLAYTLIERVYAGQTAFYLYQTGQFARIVPYRAFSGEAERQAFEGFIRARACAAAAAQGMRDAGGQR